MGFEHEELEPPEVASLSLEYLRSAARWLEEAAEATGREEVARALASAAHSTRGFHDEVEDRVRDHFGERIPAAAELSHRLRRRPEVVSVDELEHDSAVSLLEVAATEEEEAYQYFLGAADDADDPWLRELFEEMADHTRSVVLYLEAEREAVADDEGRG